MADSWKTYFDAACAFLGAGGATLVLAAYNNRQAEKKRLQERMEGAEEEEHDADIKCLRLQFDLERLSDYANRLEVKVQQAIDAFCETYEGDAGVARRDAALRNALNNVQVEMHARPKLKGGNEN